MRRNKMQTKLDRSNIEDIMPLTPMQEGMLFHYIMEADSLEYHEQISLGFTGDLDVDLMQKAWDFVICNNEMLRTVYRWKNINNPVQVILKNHQVVVHYHDLSEGLDSLKESMLEKIKQADLQNRINIEEETLRITLCKCGENDFVMIISNHHILFDGWSSGIIIKELIGAYHALYEGLEPSVPFKNKFSEYVKWIGDQDKDKQKNYWENYLYGVQQNDDLFSKASQSEMTSYECALQKDVCDKLTEFAKENGLTIASLLYCAWGILAQKLNNAHDIMFGITTSGRDNPIKGIENMVGLFINTIPLRIRTDKEETIIQLLKKVNEKIKEGQEFDSTPLVDIHAYAGISNNSQLFNSLVVIENYPLDMNDYQDGILTINDYSAIERTNYNLTLGITIGEPMTFNFGYNCFAENMIKRIGQYFEKVLSVMIYEKGSKVIDIDILSESERNQILYEFNDTFAEYPRDKTVHQLFEEQVVKTPDNVALIFNKECMTYGELNVRSNRLARLLREKGVKSEDVVGIMVERSSLMIIGILGILKSGGAYLPIDPGYPKERIKFMLEDSESTILLTQSWLSDQIEFEGEKINLDDEKLYTGNAENLDKLNRPSDLAYVIYTSGSTGKPKGVMVEHQSVVNHIIGQINNLNLVEDSRVLQASPISFDASVGQIFTTILSGASLYLIDKNMLLDRNKLIRFLSDNRITDLIYVVPSLLVGLNLSGLTYLRRVTSGGDICTLSLIKGLNLDNGCEFTNIYGPTETTIISSTYPVTLDDINLTIPIGKPISNTKMYILNTDNNPVPLGVYGELYIGGDSLARGYLNRPELTAEKFVTNPFIEGERMYRTGDLARFLPDGNIEFLGRMDHQVKIRGFRIELGEIENQILKLDVVKETVVIATEDEMGEKYLCAYIVSKEEIATSELRSHLSLSLPDYMIPSYFVQMENMPLTSSGKLDRKGLPEPDGKTEAEYVAPRNTIEDKLVKIWSEVLSREKVGIYDNFFELGGHSLKVIKLVSIARQHGIELSIQDVFNKPSIALLSDHTIKSAPHTIEYRMEDFTTIHQLLENNKINDQSTPIRKTLGDVLITGATGWLGAHVLDKFISSEKGMAYCLIRGKDLADSQNRLNDSLTYYFDGKYMNCSRIVVIRGDIIEKCMLDYPIDTIFHCAASVKHYGTYSYFHDINVKGTQNVILLAKEKSAKLIHVSTTSVGEGDVLKDADNVVPIIYDETKLFVGQDIDSVYVRSKFEAEIEVLKAKLEGLNAIVVRVGNLTNRFHDLKFQKNQQENAFLTRLKMIVELEVYPQDLKSLKLEMSPVDYTGEAIIKLAQHFNHNYSLFHVYNPKTTQFIDFINALEIIGQKIDAVPYENFLSKLETATHIAGKEQIYEMIGKGKNETIPISIDNDFTCSYLREIGFEWCKIDDKYLKAYVQYFNQLGYWEDNH